MQLIFDADREQDTDRFGAALASVLPPGAVVALTGTLGAGKTRLVQAVAKAVGIDAREVVSPTFVLVHEYDARVQPATSSAESGSGFRVQGSLTGETPDHQTPDHQPPVSTIYHLDAYRICDDDEFRELGPEEYFDSGAWTFIEWADRVADCLPSDYLRIAIDVTSPTARHFTVSAQGERLTATIEALRDRLSPT
jgi:tRNA threonylcarbamoyladenosine biosynthesis protein TsaE